MASPYILTVSLRAAEPGAHSWSEVFVALKRVREYGPSDISGVTANYDVHHVTDVVDENKRAALLLQGYVLRSEESYTAGSIMEAAREAQPPLPADVPPRVNLYKCVFSTTSLAATTAFLRAMTVPRMDSTLVVAFAGVHRGMVSPNLPQTVRDAAGESVDVGDLDRVAGFGTDVLDGGSVPLTDDMKAQYDGYAAVSKVEAAWNEAAVAALVEAFVHA